VDYPTCEFIFTGQRYDAESQIYHYKARFYVPKLGRFGQNDPIVIAGGINLYAAYHVVYGGVDPLGTDVGWTYRLTPNDPYGDKGDKLSQGGRQLYNIGEGLPGTPGENNESNSMIDASVLIGEGWNTPDTIRGLATAFSLLNYPPHGQPCYKLIVRENIDNDTIRAAIATCDIIYYIGHGQNPVNPLRPNNYGMQHGSFDDYSDIKWEEMKGTCTALSCYGDNIANYLNKQTDGKRFRGAAESLDKKVFINDMVKQLAREITAMAEECCEKGTKKKSVCVLAGKQTLPKRRP